MPLSELPCCPGKKEPSESLQEIPLSSASTSQHGSWKNGCELRGRSCLPFCPLHPFLNRAGTAFRCQPYTFLSFVFFPLPQLAPFQGPTGAPPLLSWVLGSLPKLIFPIFPPSSLPSSLMSLLGWNLPKRLQTPQPCPALTLKVPPRPVAAHCMVLDAGLPQDSFS